MPSFRGTPRWYRNRSWRAHGPLLLLAGAGVLAVSVIGLVVVLQLRQAAMQHELRKAEHDAQIAGKVIAPLVTDAALDGDPAAIGRLDRAVRNHLLHEPTQRVKLWTPGGRIIYSDERRLIGRTFDLDAKERALVKSGGATSELSDLNEAENRFERGEEDLLEVYTRVSGPARSPVLLETYESYDTIGEDSRELWRAALPALLIGLLLLELVNLGFAHWFAGRIRRGDQQRAALLGRALDASNRERRRIAADLHDGVVQDLTAASLTVAGATRTLHGGDAAAETTTALEGAAETMRESVGALRTLLMDFYPADLERRGLEASLGDLVAAARTRGLQGEVEVAADMDAPPATEGVLYRVAQEAVRNAITHAQASYVRVRAGTDREFHWLEVADDGLGFDPERGAGHGHMGLRALSGLLTDAGGRLEVRSTPGDGAAVRALLPVE